ncbi:MAG: polysaccharide deacetylase family protein [Clostridiales bacterium]|jgi:polysaccharide deacetylase family sporulation protein PdaB|nr:polysaccharide deacetylase family protein [Clostridiales bacterium]
MRMIKIAALLLSAALVLPDQGIIAARRKLPIFSVETPEQVVALTFNAAYASADTEVILDILRDNGIKASFFLCGIWIGRNPGLLERMKAEGHDIGNHGDTHAHVASMSLSAVAGEISGTHQKIKTQLGIEMNLFRPPYGEYNDVVVEAAEALGYYTIQWDVDSHDWMNKGEEAEVWRVLEHKKLRNGSIILFHTDAKHTAAALPRIIEGLKDMGYGFVPVSKLIYTEDYEIDHEGRQVPKRGAL